MELSESKLRSAVDGNEQVELPFFGAHLGDVDVEVADGVALERLPAPHLAFDRRQPADVMALKQAMQR